MRFQKPKNKFVEMNLNDVVDVMGEEATKAILSSFSCPKNKDVERFLHSNAILFSKQGLSKTHLVFWQTDDEKEKELVGYYTMAAKYITISRDAVNSREARKLRTLGIFDKKTNTYTVWVPLIAQLGKNFTDQNNLLITGDELLALAMARVQSAQADIGGRFVYLESENNEKLKEFYRRNNFKIFGDRKLDRDETDLYGSYLLQWFIMLS